MIKLRGFGGKTEFWDHNLESFTLMAGLAAVTSKIQIYATAATPDAATAIVLGWPPTIDSISGGRFGVNLVTGWQNRIMTRWACAREMTISPAAMTISPNTSRCSVTCGAPGAAIQR